MSKKNKESQVVTEEKKVPTQEEKVSNKSDKKTDKKADKNADKNKKFKKKKEKKNKLNIKENAKGTASELKKVTWPSFSEVVRRTGVVLAVVLIFAVILFGIDVLFEFIFGFFK